MTPAQAALGAWRVRFTCCGRDDGEQVFPTWAEADQAREAYSSGAGVAHEGYSADATAPGHRRAGIITQAALGAGRECANSEQHRCAEYHALEDRLQAAAIEGETLEAEITDLRARLATTERLLNAERKMGDTAHTALAVAQARIHVLTGERNKAGQELVRRDADYRAVLHRAIDA